MINELAKVLEQETALYGEILDISKGKTNVIVEGKVSELESIVKIEQSILFQIGRLEDQREILIGKLSEQLGLGGEEVILSKILKHADSENRKKLKACQDKMHSTVNELKNTNELNSKLIKNSLDYINFSLNIITEVNAINTSYGNDGQASGSKKRNLFDVKL